MEDRNARIEEKNLDEKEKAAESPAVTENPAAAEQPAETEAPALSKGQRKRAERKAKKQRWKAAKKQRRAELKERYKDAPWLTRLCRVYLLKPFVIVLVVAALLAVLVFGVYPLIMNGLVDEMSRYFDDNKDNPVEAEQIYEISPIDEEGAARIAATEPIGEDETWTICLYLVGADLEDMGENDLAPALLAQTYQARQEGKAQNQASLLADVERFSGELGANGLELPQYLFQPQKNAGAEETYEEAAESAEATESVEATEKGYASEDIEEILSGVWSENVSVVLQTGGATRWSNQMVNPNRTQRFLYKDGVFDEVANLPLSPSCEEDTLVDFLDFCKENYPADHTMLLFWDHGAGAFGFGADSLFGDTMSLRSLRSALERVYEPNSEDPAFDIIGFDACLMSTLEVTHALDGFADIYLLSQESIPGAGWKYDELLQAMTDDSTMSPAQIGQTIADSYMNYYVTWIVNVGDIMRTDVTFSVIDAHKTAPLYEAYCDLARQQLADASKDISVLAGIGRCSDRSTHYASYVYDMYNLVDMGNYITETAAFYPEKSEAILSLLKDAVLYHRESGNLSDSNGISLYVPGTINSLDALSMFMQYEYDVSDDAAIKALYYYKVAGCLNDELKPYAAEIAGTEPATLDPSVLLAIRQNELEIGEDGFSVPAPRELWNMIQKERLALCLWDEETQSVTWLGQDAQVSYEEGRGLKSSFDGQWISIGGVPLAAEVTAMTRKTTDYRALVVYEGTYSYLLFSSDNETGEFSITGIRELPEDLMEDPINFLVNSKTLVTELEGAVIQPVYEVVDLETGYAYDEYGSEVKVTKKTKIRRSPLSEGYYLSAAAVTDQRGDVYYSRTAGQLIEDGRVTERVYDPDFRFTDTGIIKTK